MIHDGQEMFKKCQEMPGDARKCRKCSVNLQEMFKKMVRNKLGKISSQEMVQEIGRAMILHRWSEMFRRCQEIV